MSETRCSIPIDRHWHVMDGLGGWYVVDPSGAEDGPYKEAAADRVCAERKKAYPVAGCTCKP